MSNIQSKKPTFPRLYTIHSQKGGVGKTSIAIAIAGFAAIAHKKKTLIIDADLTGTSLIDIPNFSSSEDKLDKKEKFYFNDLILANPTDFGNCTPIIKSSLDKSENKQHLRPFYHDVPGYDEISYFPASPDLSEIRKTIPLISQEDYLLFFRLRLEDIIVTAMMDGIEVIVIDHPPGLYGISTASLRMILDQNFNKTKNSSRLSKLINGSEIKAPARDLSCHTILCTTSDPVDYKAIFPSLSMLLCENLEEKEIEKKISEMEIDVFLNKAGKDSTSGRFDAPIAWSSILNKLEELPEGRNLNDKLLEILKQRLCGPGACAGEYVENFSMDKILLAIAKLKQQQQDKETFSGIEGWCSQLSKIVNL